MRIRGTAYPVLLPTLRDPRLHLAAVIISLHVLGQVAFDFNLSIAQILVAVLTSAILEVGDRVPAPARAHVAGERAPDRERRRVHPARAGHRARRLVEHERLVDLRRGPPRSRCSRSTSSRSAGRHVFNPSNFGLVPCFLLLGPERADPLAFWWGPLSPALVLALALIVAGGFAILGRLHLTEIAVGFWLAFAAGIGVLAASGHTMTAAWHVGPIEGAEFWWTLVSSPEILVFLFFMITDPRTIPASRAGRRAYAVGVGLLATLLIAPFTTEFAAKVAVLGALFIVCAARPLLVLLGSTRSRRPDGAASSAAAAAFVCGAPLALAGAVAFAASSSRPGSRPPGARPRRPTPSPRAAPRSRRPASEGVAPIDQTHGRGDRARRRRRPRRRGGRAPTPRPRPRGGRRDRRVARRALGADRRAQGEHDRRPGLRRRRACA